jgi:hypothetical protein
MSEKRIHIGYIGDDAGFWSKIQRKFREIYSVQKFEFINVDVSRGFNPGEIFIELVDLNLDIIYIDFSLGIENSLTLCKRIRRDSVTKRLSTTALHTLKDFKKTIPLTMLAGTRLNHIKSSELHDVAFDAMCLHDVENIENPEFATADAEMEAYMTQDIRISWMDYEKFHIETNSPLINGDKIYLEEHFLEEIMPNRNMIITNFSDSDMYFDQRFSYDLEFEYLEPFTEDRYEAISDKGTKHKVKLIDKENRVKKIGELKSKLKKWIGTRRVTSVDPKKVKFLLIDRSLTILRDKNIDIDKLPYVLNIQSRLVGQLETVQRFLPNVIAFNYEAPDVETEDDADSLNINGLISLRNLLGAINFLKGYEPIILVFNFPGSKNLITTDAAYPKLLVHDKPFSFEVIDQLAKKKIKVREKEEEIEKEKADLLESSLQGFKHEQIEAPQKVFFGSRDPETLVKMIRPIKIIQINECLIYFETEQHIPFFTVFAIEDPIDALITVIPTTSTERYYNIPGIYKALINGVDDMEKKNIRQVINNLIYIMKNPNAFESSPERIKEKRDKEFAEIQKFKGDNIEKERSKQAAVVQRKIDEAKYETDKLKKLEEKESELNEEENPYKKPEA